MHPVQGQFPISHVKTHEYTEQLRGIKYDSFRQSDDAREGNANQRLKLTDIKNKVQRDLDAVPKIKIRSDK